MKYHVLSELPTIYADMNIYRYIAYGDIIIEKPERFKWIYSHVHLAELMRNGNTDALEGMKILNAIEVEDVLNYKFESCGNIVLHGYIDPYERYKQHQVAVAGYENSGDHMVEYLIRLFGADNFKELSMTPEKLHEEIDRLTSNVSGEIRTYMLERAKEVSKELEDHINKDLNEKRPIDITRIKLGITSNIRERAEKSDSPIDEIWKIISPALNGVTKDQFFGFVPMPATQGIQHTQHSALAGAHLVLNMLGLSPDKGLANRDKIKNIISDGQHVGMASYCNGFLSADRRFCDKANAIYKHVGSSTNALYFQYNKGCVIQLEVVENMNDT